MRKGIISVWVWGMLWVIGFMPSPVGAATEPFIGEMMMTGANFCPRGWAGADGQLLPINQYQALFSLLGTMYGGDGRTTFGLPDLRGRVPLHSGNGPGLSMRRQGEKGGEEQHGLALNEMPPHQHALNASSGKPSQDVATGNLMNAQGRKREFVPPGAGVLTPMHPTTVGPTGSGVPHNIMQPYLSVRFCIALQGIFPSRN
jgi:microcystin-dependent protein